MAITRELLHRLPKTDLHVHLDGSLRAETMLELASDIGVALPANDADSLRAYMHVSEVGDLVDYLKRFEITLALMQTETSLERIAYELAADAAAENVRYMEVRFCPALNTRRGLPANAVIEAALHGLRRAAADHDIRCSIIVCGLRNLPVSTSIEMAQLAIDYRDRGVVAFDLAGAEHGHPPSLHVQAFQLAAEANLGITVHAGEAFDARSIHQALHRCHARRIGHGTRLWQDPDLMRFVNDYRIPLEICLTSNVQTGAADSLAEHPLRLYFEQGIVVTLNTDNRLMSGTTMTDEFAVAHQALGLDWDELCAITMMGFQSAFLPYHDKLTLVQAVEAEIRTLTGHRA